MEARIEKLAEFVDDARDRLTKIEKRLDQTATKGDLEGLRSEMHKGCLHDPLVRRDCRRHGTGTPYPPAAPR
jgi:hypothetical protein